MLRITAIQKAKKGGYHLFIEEEYALTISAEVLAETGLAVGQQITPQRLDEIRQICDRRRARERALYLLESRSHSEKELYDKLCRSVPEQIAADVTCRMVELGLWMTEPMPADGQLCCGRRKNTARGAFARV